MYSAIKRTFKRDYDIDVIMDKQPSTTHQSTNLETLRTAFILVVKQQSLHGDFLRVSRETEERLSVSRPSTMFFYGL